jgi:hypothetical protein
MNDLKRFAEEFERQSGRHDGPKVVAGLHADLELLSNLLYSRLHQDVEATFGEDSMLMPSSELKSRLRTRIEVGLYEVAESAVLVRQQGYLPSGSDWYIPWLAELCLAESPLEPEHRGSTAICRERTRSDVWP